LARIADLESSSDTNAVKQVIDLSKRFHVMSRYTSLLVLENGQMFAEFGIKRTAPPPSGLSANDLALGAPFGTGSLGAARAEGSRGAPADNNSQGAPASGWTDEATSGSGPSAGPAATAAPPPPPSPAAQAPMRSAPSKAAESAFESEDSRRRMSETPPMAPAAPEPKTEASAKPDARLSNGFFAGGELGLDASGGRSAVQGRVELGLPQVNGSLPADVVRRIVANNLGRIRLCYESGLRKNPRLAGRVTVRFIIGQMGDVPSSMDGGSNLADPSVVACIVAAVRSLVFASPAGGFVTVVFPLTLSPNSLVAAPSYIQTEPTASHRVADESWLGKGEDALVKLRSALAANQTSRKKYEDLVRGLLARGRFEEALATAKRLVSMDPDLPVARELLAYAAVASDDAELAARAIDTQTETDPTSLKWHVRGARSFEALGDERRACAHWRSLAELAPQSDEFAFESWRCRARVLDQRDGVLTEARSGKPSKLVSELIAQVEASKPPPFSTSVAGPGQFEAAVTCSAGERCPTVLVVSPNGTVFSPFTPTDSRSSAHSVAFAGLRDGTYVTVLSGGSPDARGELTLRTFGSTKKFPIAHGGRQTVAATRVTLPNYTLRPMWGAIGEGFLVLR
jgi:Ca-activated chloride channel family protein